MCAKELDREEAVIVIVDDSINELIASPTNTLDYETFIRGYMNFGNLRVGWPTCPSL